MRRQSFVFTSKSKNPDTGRNESWVVTSQFVAKGNSEDSPYLVANEFICGRLAEYLCLNIPPFGFMRHRGRHKGHKMLFASLKFSKTDTEPDDFDAAACCKALPNECTGILLFDALVMNSDRNRCNIQVDKPSEPKWARIFDHDHALFGTFASSGIQRLHTLEDRLGMTGGEMTGGLRHCLLNHLKTNAHFHEWLERIESIPDWYIREICQAVRGVPATKSEVDEAAACLLRRKAKLRKIVDENHAEFRGIKDWGMFPL